MNAQDDARVGWRTVLAVEGIRLGSTGQRIKVVVGIVATQTGYLHIAMRVGDETTVLLPTGTATQLLTNLRRVIDYKLQAES